jgi:hypothetical protein
MGYKFTDNKEPTDKELSDLMKAAIKTANERGQKATFTFMEELNQKIITLKAQMKHAKT